MYKTNHGVPRFEEILIYAPRTHCDTIVLKSKSSVVPIDLVNTVGGEGA